MTGKRSAPAAAAGAQPSAKRLASSPRRFNFETMSDIPPEIRARKVSKCFVEFLDIAHEWMKPDDKRANHCVMRLEFKHNQGRARGVYIDLVFTGNTRLKSCPAKLTGKKATWDGANQTARKILDVPIRKGRGRNNTDKTVKDFLRVILESDLIPCSYNTDTGEDGEGCRDFISQYVYRLNEANVLKITESNRQEIYDTFNHGYGPAMDESHPSRVGYACFSDVYHAKHHAIDVIQYMGNRMSRDSREANLRSRGASQFRNGGDESG